MDVVPSPLEYSQVGHSLQTHEQEYFDARDQVSQRFLRPAELRDLCAEIWRLSGGWQFR